MAPPGDRAAAGWAAVGSLGLGARLALVLGRPSGLAHLEERTAAWAAPLTQLDDRERSYSAYSWHDAWGWRDTG